MKSLLKVTRKAELGLLLMSELARHNDGLLSLVTFADEIGASFKFLEQVACALRKAGLIEGVRGAAGGYRLARVAQSVTVAEIFMAVEGPMEIEGCTARLGPFTPTDAAHHLITQIQGQVMSSLMNTTLAQIERYG